MKRRLSYSEAMKFLSTGFFLAVITAAVLSLVATTGCRTTPKVDWDSRIGTYTYDQAITELGPPDKTAKLSDNRTVAEWVTGYKRGSTVSLGTGIFGGNVGFGAGQTVGGNTRARILRLTFDQENRLAGWVTQ